MSRLVVVPIHGITFPEMARVWNDHVLGIYLPLVYFLSRSDHHEYGDLMYDYTEKHPALGNMIRGYGHPLFSGVPVLMDESLSPGQVGLVVPDEVFQEEKP